MPEDSEDQFDCDECGQFGQESFTYQRTVANGDIWVCNNCRSELITKERLEE